MGSLLSLLRQAFSLETEFGTRSIEALLWIAETVEESVYEAGSLACSSEGIVFNLVNPPLRVGAFGAVRLQVDGAPVDPSRLRLRSGPGTPWTTADRITPDSPWLLVPGGRTEFAADGPAPRIGRAVRLRLEWESLAIPPLVWFEFSDVARPGGPG